MQLITTLNEIRSHSPCAGGWGKLLTNLGKTKADDEPLNIMTVLESNNIEDAVWCLRCFERDSYRQFNADVAESVLHIFESKYPDDDRPRKAIAAARGNASAAADAAYAAAADATAAAADATADAAAAAAADAYAAYAAAADAAYAAYAAAADATYAAACAAADAAAYVAYTAAYAAAATARKNKWTEIEQLFIKRFGE
jgi:hypothetical protein